MTDLLKPIITSLQIDDSPEMANELLQKVRDFVSGVDANAGASKNRQHDDPAEFVPKLASVSFTGRMTSTLGWYDTIAKFVDDFHLPVNIASDFSRNFEDLDLLSLSKLNQVWISIDSSSPETMQNLRSVDLRTVIANVVRLRQAMLETGKKAELQFNCTVTRSTLTHLGGLARLALLLQVDALNIGDAADAAANAIPSDSLEDLDDADAQRLALSLIDAVNALKDSATKVNLLPSLKNRLEPVVVAMSEGKPVTASSFRAGARGANFGPCLQPWDTVIVEASGNVRLCRGPLEPVGSLDNESLIGLINGFRARKLRETLLEGGRDLPCGECRFSTSDSPQAFLENVRRAHERYDAAIHPWQAAVPTGMDYDAQFGISTQAKIFLDDLDPEAVGPALEHATHYLPTAVESIDIILDAIPIPPESCTLIDLGCGMGRVLLHAAKRPFRQIVGVELSPALLDVAKQNLESYKGPLACRDIVLVRADAAEYVYPSGDIVVFMNNPFSDAILKPVIERLSRHTGRVIIAYHGPVHKDIIDANPRFAVVGHFALADPRQTCRMWQSR